MNSNEELPPKGPCLRTTATIARAAASCLGVPLVGVNHAVAHIEIARLDTGFADPVILYVSGGNTMVLSYNAGKYRVFGETLDIALGNMIDSVARVMGLPHPGGPHIERLAKKGQKYVPLPYSVKGMDFSFSGMYTAASRLVGKERNEDIAYSIQETAFAMLAEVTERAMAFLRKEEVILTGGVVANQRLQEIIQGMAESRGAKFGVVRKELAGDNGVMIAWAGYLALESGEETPLDALTLPDWRPDQVEIRWWEKSIDLIRRRCT